MYDFLVCLDNHFGITDWQSLERIESCLVERRQGQLESSGAVLGQFDTAHLRKIHWHLFRDVYAWAGQFREAVIGTRLTDLPEAQTAGFLSAFEARFGIRYELPFPPPFTDSDKIGSSLEGLFSDLARENFLVGLTSTAFASRAAFYWGRINAVHGFREGNGRTQREFIRQLGLRAGHRFSWSSYTREDLRPAGVQSHRYGDNSGLAALIADAIQKENYAHH